MNDGKKSTIMKKGVVVEKEKARVAYEEIVRKKRMKSMVGDFARLIINVLNE